MTKTMAIKVLMKLLARYDGGPVYEALCMAVDAIEEQRRNDKTRHMNGGTNGKS